MSDASTTWILAFVRGGVRYGLSAGPVHGVAARTYATRVPGAPLPLRGVIAWRGNVVPLIEPGACTAFGWAAVVVVGSDGGEMALVADSVEGWTTRDKVDQMIDVNALQQHIRDAVRRASESESGSADAAPAEGMR